MKAKKTVPRCFLTLLIGIGGCGSGSRSTGSIGSSKSGISISPVSAIAGSPDLVLTVTGANFVDGTHNRSVVAWSANGNDQFLATTFVSSTQLTAVISAALLANPVTVKVSVETGDPLGSGDLRQSNSVSFSVITAKPGQPSISSISPTSAAVGSPDLTLTITGSNFANGNGYRSHAVWSNDTFLATTFVSDTQLTAVIPAAFLINPLTAGISVQTWYLADSFPTGVSNSVDFSVTAP